MNPHLSEADQTSVSVCWDGKYLAFQNLANTYILQTSSIAASNKTFSLNKSLDKWAMGNWEIAAASKSLSN